MTTKAEEAVGTNCSIMSWLRIAGTLILGAFLGIVGWNCWLTLRVTAVEGTVNLRIAEVEKVAAVTAITVTGMRSDLNELKVDVKELLKFARQQK